MLARLAADDGGSCRSCAGNREPRALGAQRLDRGRRIVAPMTLGIEKPIELAQGRQAPVGQAPDVVAGHPGHSHKLGPELPVNDENDDVSHRGTTLAR